MTASEKLSNGPATCKRRLDAFNNSLPWIYRYFLLRKAPNPGLCEHLFRFWRNPDTVDEGGNGLPGVFGFEQPGGLLLHGDPRTGKTQIACELVRRQLAVDWNANGRFLSVVQWGAETTTRAKECRLDTWVEETMRFVWKEDPEYSLSGYLILDDLDKARFSDTVESQLFNLVETATTHDVALIVTTNVSALELVRKFKDRTLGRAIVARLQEFCTPVDMGVKLPAIQTSAVAP